MSDKNKLEADVRYKLEDLRDRLVNRFGAKATRLLFYAIPTAILLLIIIFVGLMLIPIKNIVVEGDVTMFNEGDIIEACEISEGESLFWHSSRKIEKNLKDNLPLASLVDVKKSLFGKVKIYVEFDDVDFYISKGNMYYAIDEDLKVLDADRSWSKYSAVGGVRVYIPEIRDVTVGEKIVFFDTVEETDTEGETLYEVKEEKVYYYINEFLFELQRSGYLSEANAILLDEKFDIRLIYANKFSIRFGDSRDLDAKFRVLYEILAEGSSKYFDKVTVDVSNPAEATARGDTSLDFSQYVD